MQVAFSGTIPRAEVRDETVRSIPKQSIQYVVSIAIVAIIIVAIIVRKPFSVILVALSSLTSSLSFSQPFQVMVSRLPKIY